MMSPAERNRFSCLVTFYCWPHTSDLLLLSECPSALSFPRLLTWTRGDLSLGVKSVCSPWGWRGASRSSHSPRQCWALRRLPRRGIPAFGSKAPAGFQFCKACVPVNNGCSILSQEQITPILKRKTTWIPSVDPLFFFFVPYLRTCWLILESREGWGCGFETERKTLVWERSIGQLPLVSAWPGTEPAT